MQVYLDVYFVQLVLNHQLVVLHEAATSVSLEPFLQQLVQHQMLRVLTALKVNFQTLQVQLLVLTAQLVHTIRD